MTILAFILAGVTATAWLATVGTILYGLITHHTFIEGMFYALIIVTFAAAAAFAGAASLLGYQ